ncbi:MET1 [Candida oxycetoniae]|uniref:MET1 n=1 Tax=Candida oxycetoniae TaxID=497107 RepID=A0AAI9T0Y0_9ASCO|nr:MET1 [Candida oxycetoniae]KAI3406768.2 MET1 [Candida oxycetoniae]
MVNLLASLNSADEIHLLIGYSNITNSRVTSIINAKAIPILIVPEGSKLSPSITTHCNEEKLKILIDNDFSESNIRKHLTTLGRSEVNKIVDKVFVTLSQAQLETKQYIYRQCRALRIPINTTDCPELCTFTLLSTHSQGDFQMGVTTNGKGCKLASRLRRELVSHLPPNVDKICDKVGDLRKQIQEQDKILLEELEVGEHDDDSITSHKFNSLVHEFDQTQEEIKLRRNRWLSQIVEYYPLSKLADLSIKDLKTIYKESSLKDTIAQENVAHLSKKGKITLVGSGPGSVSLLTVGALQAINQADLILADKLVPQQVLDLIPKTHGPKLFIARKFPGNAEKAQEELLAMALDGLKQNQFVLRLKQGDPYIFGRGGEEYTFFQERGYEPTVVPGISSALAAPVLAQIPMTHRDVADQVLICTGTGRKGAVPNLPFFEPSRTTIFLMALHRIVDLIPLLIEQKGWVRDLPVAIIERASCPDQRVIRTTLEKVAEAVETCGSRPPGLLVTGYACNVIYKQLAEETTKVEEGFECGFDISKLLVA